jgi:kynureninase
MPSTFSPTPGAAGWQFSNPSVLDVISLFAALKSFTASSECGPKTLDDSPLSAGSLPILRCLRAKGMDVTTYLEALLQSSPHFVPLADLPSQSSRTTPHFTIITPSDPSCRGSQLSLLFQPVEIMEPVFEGLRERGVIGDERRPGVIRIAPVPMYTRWEDCRLVAAALEAALAAIGV